MSTEIKDINLGGIADSIYQGIANSVAALVGLDIHGKPGIVTCNQRLVKDSGSTVDDAVSAMVACSDGNTYFFGKTNGKIWKRIPAGTWSLEATAAPAAGAVGIMDAKEMDGYIYYSMQSRLGRWQLGTAWSTRDDNWATFDKTDPDFHPIDVQNLVMYIGDKNRIADVDNGIFHPQGVLTSDLDAKYRCKTFATMINDLVIGTFISDNVNATNVFRWNTWGQQVTSHDDCPEIAINAFIPTDNYIFAQCGNKGNFYSYDGSQLKQSRRLPGDWTGTKTADVKPNAVATYRGLPMFGVSNISGNPCLQGVYSLGGYSSNYPAVLALEYVISTGHTANIEIHAMQAVGNLLFVSWKDLNSGTTYGVDVVDLTQKSSGGYFDTRVYAVSREEQKSMFAKIAYRSLPANTSFQLWASVNGAAFTQISDLKQNSENLLYSAESNLEKVLTIQYRVVLVASVNDSPEFENLLIL